MDHKYSTYTIFFFIFIVLSGFVWSLESSDVDELCAVNNSILFRYNDTWVCASLNDTVINYTINEIINVFNNWSDYAGNWDMLDTPFDFLLSMFDVGNWIDQDIDMNGNDIVDVNDITADTFIGNGSGFNDLNRSLFSDLLGGNYTTQIWNRSGTSIFPNNIGDDVLIKEGDLNLTITDELTTGPVVNFDHITGTPNVNDVMGEINFQVSGATRAFIKSKVTVNGGGSTGIDFDILKSGGFQTALSLTHTGVVINQDSADINTRIESDDDINMFFLDANLNRICIGCNTPAVELDVVGKIYSSDNIKAVGTILVDDADGGAIVNEACSTTNPTLIPDRGSTGAGIGGGGGTVSLITGGFNALYVDTSQNVYMIGDLDVTGNITSENVFIPAYISSHTNDTINVAVAGKWYNVTFNHEEDEFKERITHIFSDDTNVTFTIVDDGVYEITYSATFQDSAAVPTSHVVTRVTKNSVELNGFTQEEDLGIKDQDKTISHSDLVSLSTGDTIELQFTSSDTTVSLQGHLTYGTHLNTGHINIKKMYRKP